MAKSTMSKSTIEKVTRKTTAPKVNNFEESLWDAANRLTEEDLLGRVYEYFPGKFASSEGKGGGGNVPRTRGPRSGWTASPFHEGVRGDVRQTPQSGWMVQKNAWEHFMCARPDEAKGVGYGG